MTDEQPLSPGNQAIPGVNQDIPGLQDLTKVNRVIPDITRVSVGEDMISQGEGRGELGLDHRKFVWFDENKAIDLLIQFPKNISHICRTLGVSRGTFDYHRRNNPEFAARVQEVEEANCDDLEGVMLELGKAKTSFNFNDRIAYLRAHRPELYNPARKIVVESHTMSADEISRRSAILGQAVDAQIVNAYTTRKERLQAKREGSSLLPSGKSEGDGGAGGEGQA